jgi:transcriptional regulator of arginine metabolism
MKLRKKDRHRLIVKLLNEHEIGKQEEFVDILKEQGIIVTQATISRDINELQLIKVPNSRGGFKYAMPAETIDSIDAKIERAMTHSVVNVTRLDNQVMIRTIPGNAAVVKGLIYKRYADDIFAILNDDDGVFIVFKSVNLAVQREVEIKRI